RQPGSGWAANTVTPAGASTSIATVGISLSVGTRTVTACPSFTTSWDGSTVTWALAGAATAKPTASAIAPMRRARIAESLRGDAAAPDGAVARPTALPAVGVGLPPWTTASRGRD